MATVVSRAASIPYDCYEFENALSETLDDAYVVFSDSGFATAAFHIVPPTGGTVAFEATFDGDTNWVSITLRGVNSDVLAQSASAEDDYIGSIAGAHRIRFRTSVGGSAPGTVSGHLSRIACVIETIEFGAPPHKFGYIPVHKDASYTTAQTGSTLWQPASGKRFVVTDLIVTGAGGTDGRVTIFDGTDAVGKRLFNAYMQVNNQGTFGISQPLVVPFVSEAADNVLKVTTSADITVDVIVHGYEI